MQIDPPPIFETDISKFMWYHLRMAVAFFKELPGDYEVHRQNILIGLFSEEINDPLMESGAGIAFMDKLNDYYKSFED